MGLPSRSLGNKSFEKNGVFNYSKTKNFIKILILRRQKKYLVVYLPTQGILANISTLSILNDNIVIMGFSELFRGFETHPILVMKNFESKPNSMINMKILIYLSAKPNTRNI